MSNEPKLLPEQSAANKYVADNWHDGLKFAGSDSKYTGFWAFIGGVDWARKEQPVAHAAPSESRIAEIPRWYATRQITATSSFWAIWQDGVKDAILRTKSDTANEEKIVDQVIAHHEATAKLQQRLDAQQAQIEKAGEALEEIAKELVLGHQAQMQAKQNYSGHFTNAKDLATDAFKAALSAASQPETSLQQIDKFCQECIPWPPPETPKRGE